MLYLKKIEMYGFKSFADKVELKFDQPVTAVVGPNGCGKSNISDAIRWVLGEQSTKNLRGKLMQDLIFSGTDKRKSMSYCEVSLYMDNTTRIFPIQMDEIIISRKLYRNNESEYLLNRNVVRLRDILDLLRGVGLGKEGYSIVGQGRMDAVLSAKPEDRRAIFEEAMGLSSFRVKKEETERRLEKTRLNIQQIMILVEELKHRLPELKRQSTNAHKYLEIFDELKLCEINAYIYGYDNASQDKENGKKKLAGLKEELAMKENTYAEINEKYDEVFHRRSGIDSEIAALRDKQVALAVLTEKNAGEKSLVQERINNCNKEIDSQKSLIDENNNAIEQLSQQNEQLALLLQRRKDEFDVLDNEVLQVADKSTAVGRRVEQISGELDELRKKLDEVLTATNDCTSKLASLQTEKTTLSARLEAIDKKQTELSTKLQDTAGIEGDLFGKYESLRKKKEELEKTSAQLKQQIKELEYKLFESNKALQQKQQAYSSEKGGIDMLKDFANNYKGYQASVQSLMTDSKHDQALASHICGVVGNMLKVEQKYQVAIETALGGHLQNIVTKNEEDVKYLINYLKINDYGKATFLPVSSMKPHAIERSEVLAENGVIGVASDLVGYDKQYDNVVKSLLGGIIIVDTFDNAVAISKKYNYTHRMVTLTGERVSNDGSLEGGSSKKQAMGNLLSYESQIEERNKTLEKLFEELNIAQQDNSQLENKLNETRNTQANVMDALSVLNVEIATAKEKIETSNTISNSDKQSIIGLSNEKETIASRFVEIDHLTNSNNELFKELTDTESRLRVRIDNMKETLTSENVAKDSIQQVLADKRYRLAVLKSNIDSTEKEIVNNTNQIAAIKESIESKLAYIEQVKTAIENLKLSLNESSANTALQQEMDELLQQIKLSDSLKEQLDNDFQYLGDQRIELSTELEQLRGNIDHEDYVLNKIDDDLAELQQRVQEEYGISYSAAMQYKAETYDKEATKQRISELKVALQHLGSVNVDAIQDLEITQKRYDDLMKQIDDLTHAEQDLKTAIKDLTVDIESRFEENMEKINENFKVIFRELFNGGNARLYIDHDPTKDSLDHGVEIEAQPSGKKLQNISLLSGGERTMTAAAILFAILKFNPMPFCILDEIEAALDDANAERIAKYLRKFSSSTQFVVITHKKPTMENADVLYGVTMEERGVSKIVSVKLTDAIAQAVKEG